MKLLNGHKTQIVVGIGVLLIGAESMGLLPKGTVDQLDTLLTLLGLGAIRSAVRKL